KDLAVSLLEREDSTQRHAGGAYRNPFSISAYPEGANAIVPVLARFGNSAWRFVALRDDIAGQFSSALVDHLPQDASQMLVNVCKLQPYFLGEFFSVWRPAADEAIAAHAWLPGQTTRV